MPKQLSHKDHQASQPIRKIKLVCENLRSPANLGAIFRLSDAFGVEEILLPQNTTLNSSRFKRTSRNTEDLVFYRRTEEILSEVRQLKQKGYLILALEITDSSLPIGNLNIDKNMPVALIIGNERHGISTKILAEAQHTVHITMVGNNSSMNVAQASAIALYELTKP